MTRDAHLPTADDGERFARDGAILLKGFSRTGSNRFGKGSPI